ncbi:hypothetical protein F9C07_1289606 [Aspergillus flavus]|uniref:T6SS Phospholipase effector Tle1-like catalytic domain-containing protein n=7 Tax=Aspergillus subgen. Circumdati TaxID=2720871 RepID=A0A7U2MFE5_ASPFN|nr:unnamed protein product [Aspergillus oryzae RIB40]XP_041143188.1 uncharacterized protein G4B84_003474 [Aspergillus flavus NRRL3357]EIT76609.1 hypothetical protein Ao3042_06969 [Aspergillus oryzae 3.042]KAJ1708428.1 hypothetical protein NYO67_9397 [Aspergillus flavus]KDE80318.1 hypothetical protein AO1008_06828 [Aspergillus oryzae 100-8]KOC11065.1 hypothetical protein AFLA70_69g003160 [Aspergillus flavus AF70]OOO10187.1 Protein of unknown function DUF2235 [Aspergillus oryzae]|eukprot:EIT76609.1 hypothetical protein Ao3042_06969 [Aspergillus oryzae 3.042]
MNRDAAVLGPAPVPKQFVLCFDGTGNKFAGDKSDSNVLKIFRMLDRSESHQFHYYQPGIGTYVTSKSLSSSGRFHRIRSAYLKAKDSAVGSSFADHVMGGYKFLMRYYNPGDEISFIGFSRGAYIARFLAEMLDSIGLLEAGNEELVRFAWKTFAKWQMRRDTHKDTDKTNKLFNYMVAFRETFCRPITPRIKFMGLFDTVNSVPAFESAWMQRSKFPYTARSSAKVIRHAVGIDERRAKFRQDLISEIKPCCEEKKSTYWKDHWPRFHRSPKKSSAPKKSPGLPQIVLNGGNNEDSPFQQRPGETESVHHSVRSSNQSVYSTSHRYRARRRRSQRKLSLAVPMAAASTEDVASIKSEYSGLSLQVPQERIGGEDYDEDEDSPQDIQEVWFPGGHADIGGGWQQEEDAWPLSHAPLVWMVQEARRAGLQFDPSKMEHFECLEEYDEDYSPIRENIHWNPDISVGQDGHPLMPIPSQQLATQVAAVYGEGIQMESAIGSSSTFLKALQESCTAPIHDCLEFGSGISHASVLTWRMMEYLPFRRMDLQKNGSWKPIRWPLPCGEVRDIPDDAQIHVSAIRRLLKDENYRPGNLIVGGGGRGIRRAPPDKKIGQWALKGHKGDIVREVYVAVRPEKKEPKASTVCRDEEHKHQ